MILELKESLELGDWLFMRGLGLGEIAEILCDVECGDSFALALRRVFYKRETKRNASNEKNISDWSNPITP